MSWIVAGLIGGVGAFFADWVMWSKVFNKGMEQYVTTPASPQEVQKMMGANLPKAAVLALAFGVLLAWFYGRFKSALWVQGGGALAGMEFATVLWLPTIALSTIGGGVGVDKVRRLHKGTFWGWLGRVDVAGLLGGVLVKGCPPGGGPGVSARPPHSR